MYGNNDDDNDIDDSDDNNVDTENNDESNGNSNKEVNSEVSVLLHDIKNKHPRNMIISHYNVNSIRYKFDELKQLFLNNSFNICAFSETKLSSCFSDGEFAVDGYKLFRQDRNERGGGLIIYIHDDLPHRNLIEFSGNYEGIEYLSFEFIMKSRKWYISYIYRPPRISDHHLNELLKRLSDTFICNDNVFVAFGDLNCNFLRDNCLCDLCEVCDLHCLIKSPTCCKSENNPSLVDVFLTNKPRCFIDTFNVDLGISDFHNCTGVVSRIEAPIRLHKKITYRSMKKFSESEFQSDIAKCPFHVSEIFDDINDAYFFQEKLFKDVIDSHAPVKTKTITKHQVPYMNSELRKSINQRNMWRGKHFRKRSDKHYRAQYVKWRNRVVHLKKTSLQKYFDDRCNGISNSSFYKAIKPFMASKHHNNGSKILLCENDSIISDPSKVSEIFNAYYASIAEYDYDSDGLDAMDFDSVLKKHSLHTSISLINRNLCADSGFEFLPISSEQMDSYIKALKTNKAYGPDGLHPSFLRLAGSSMCINLSDLFNRCVSLSDFPVSLKLADISPVFKKGDPMCKRNYRSVNLLNTVSKIFERIIADQLLKYFDVILNSNLSAYRSGYSSQHVLIQLTEYWRRCLDKNIAVGTVAMDLSKAFDCMPHGLLIAKLNAYGLSRQACNFLLSYLKNRQQRVKVQGVTSEWVSINRGVPQGSVLGPLLFNIFLNDLFYVKINGMICNYADDNHLANQANSMTELKGLLEYDSKLAISWFHENYMQTNVDKFQFLTLTRGISSPLMMSVDGNDIHNCKEIKVLGVTLDSRLNFDSHISSMCKKASRQINILKRLSKYLDQNSRIIVYKSFVSSNFNYCPVAWIFCGKRNARKLERLQERALRFVFNDRNSEYHELLKRGNFLPLSVLRLRALAIEVYKCFHGLNPSYMNDIFQPKKSSYDLRDPFLLKQPTFSTKTYGFRSFGYFGSKLWNILPVELKSATSLAMFKNRITDWCHSDSCQNFIIS